MREHPMFVCAREGHKTTLTFTNLRATIEGFSITQLCTRCGAEVVTTPVVRDQGEAAAC